MNIKNVDAYNFVVMMQGAKETGILGFAIAKNMRKLADELVEYDQKRNELIRQYGADTGNGQFHFNPENAEKFFAEMKPFDEIEIDFEPMTVTEEVFCGGNLTSDQMYNLMWMVRES